MNTFSTSSIQYGNFQGNISIDSLDDTLFLVKIAEKFNINIKQYQPVGIDIFVGTNNIQIFRMITIDKIKIQDKSMTVADYVNSNKEIEVKIFDLKNFKFNDFLDKVKRLSIVLTDIPNLIGKTTIAN